MADVKLKSCPFCGGTAMLCKNGLAFGNSIYSVSCLDCNIEVTMQVNPLSNVDVPYDVKTARRMVDAWNRRAYESGTS